MISSLEPWSTEPVILHRSCTVSAAPISWRRASSACAHCSPLSLRRCSSARAFSTALTASSSLWSSLSSSCSVWAKASGTELEKSSSWPSARKASCFRHSAPARRCSVYLRRLAPRMLAQAWHDKSQLRHTCHQVRL